MSVRIGRTLPPAVASIGLRDLGHGLLAMRRKNKATAAFTDDLKEFFQVSQCWLLSSGKASLAIILQALRELQPEKDEVLIPAFTCYSVPAAIFRVGLKIRICDIEPDTLDFDYRELARQVSAPRLLCVIPTHLFGVTADIPKVRAVIGKREIAIVEDAAQVMGGERRGRKAGTQGDVGFYSLERGKAFSTVKGGIIVTNSPAIGEALKRKVAAIPPPGLSEQCIMALYAAALAVFTRPWLYWIPKSLPFLRLGETRFEPDFSIKLLSDFQSGMAADWRNRLLEDKRCRAENSAFFEKLGIPPSCPPETLFSGPLRYPVLAANREKKMAMLRQSERLGLGAADVYPGTVDTIPRLKGSIVGGCSVKARTIVERIFTLPVHPLVTGAYLRKIADLAGNREETGENYRQQPKIKEAGLGDGIQEDIRR